MRRWLARALALAAALIGLQSAWIPVKGLLAQQLIAAAYERSLASGRSEPPWPWADATPIGRLSVPRLQLQRYVLSDASPRSLAFGPGAVDDGVGGLSLAGHRDTHFAFLGDLRGGDELIWEDAGGRRHYRISAREIADVRRHSLRQPAAGELLLSTCWPLSDWQPGGPLRLVLVGEEVTAEQQNEQLAAR